MKNKTLILKISKHKLYLTPELSYTVDDTNFPHQHFMFSERGDFYWKVKVTDYNIEKELAQFEVVDYHPHNYNDFLNQKLDNNVRNLNFENLEWSSLEKILIVYRRFELNYLLNESSKQAWFKLHPKTKQVDKFEPEVEIKTTSVKKSKTTFRPTESKPIFKPFFQDEIKSKSYEETFSYYFKDAEFCDGFVKVKKKFSYFSKPIEFEIINPEVIAEYNSIKYYFPKILGISKKFNVTTSFNIQGSNIEIINVFSKEIDLITEDIVEKIRQQLPLEIFKYVSTEEDKSLYSPDELISKITDSKNIVSKLYADNIEVLNILFKHNKVKNHKQLEYLSGYLHNDLSKVKISPKPEFGFLFTFINETTTTYLWELLDSHATYLWRYQNKSLQINNIDQEITLVNRIHRIPYKNQLSKGERSINFEFKAVYHKRSEAKNQSLFLNWKSQIHKFIDEGL